MANEVKGIEINGTTYDYKDEKARDDIADLKEDLDHKVYFDAEGYLCFKEGGIE